MASIYKLLGTEDTVNTTTNLHESIPITGAIVSGTYGTFPSGSNIKYFAAANHQAVFDYAMLSSSANHIFDLSCGVASDSDLYASAGTWSMQTKKANMYRQFAQVYKGYDQNQNVIEFDVSGSTTPADTWTTAGGDKIDNMVFLDFSRVLMKDEIKKGSFQMSLKTGSWDNAYFKGVGAGGALLTLYDDHATDTTGFKDNSPMGQYGLLKATSGTTVPTETDYGFVFYQAGLVALIGNTATWGEEMTSGSLFNPSTGQSAAQAFVSSSMENIINGGRASITNIQFNNTTELNSTIYFVRVNHNEFNYSSNPTFTSASTLVTKNVASDPSVSYITTIGLYGANNDLLAVGKLSEPLRKASDTELTLRVRLDY